MNVLRKHDTFQIFIWNIHDSETYIIQHSMHTLDCRATLAMLKSGLEISKILKSKFLT